MEKYEMVDNKIRKRIIVNNYGKIKQIKYIKIESNRINNNSNKLDKKTRI
jgi:hypothetical protein